MPYLYYTIHHSNKLIDWLTRTVWCCPATCAAVLFHPSSRTSCCSCTGKPGHSNPAREEETNDETMCTHNNYCFIMNIFTTLDHGSWLPYIAGYFRGTEFSQILFRGSGLSTGSKPRLENNQLYGIECAVYIHCALHNQFCHCSSFIAPCIIILYSIYCCHAGILCIAHAHT